LTGEKEVKSNNQMVANIEALCKLAVGKTAMAATELLHREKKIRSTSATQRQH